MKTGNKQKHGTKICAKMQKRPEARYLRCRKAPMLQWKTAKSAHSCKSADPAGP